MTSKQHYDPNRSVNHPDHLAAFLKAPIHGDLHSVPNIGDVGAEKFHKVGVLNTFHLIAKFLEFVEWPENPVNACNKYFAWLTDIGVPPKSRSSIIEAVAKRLELAFPGATFNVVLPSLEAEKEQGVPSSQQQQPLSSQHAGTQQSQQPTGGN